MRDFKVTRSGDKVTIKMTQWGKVRRFFGKRPKGFVEFRESERQA